MCGRYSLTADPRAVAQAFDLAEQAGMVGAGDTRGDAMRDLAGKVGIAYGRAVAAATTASRRRALPR